METLTSSDRMVDRALGRAVVARYLKLGLRAPEPVALQDVLSLDAKRALERASRALGDRGTEDLVNAAEALVRGPLPPLEELRASYNRLFGHSLRGRVCPYETEYGKREPLLQAQELSDIVGFYRAFGLEPAASSKERWDHIACELEFLELLSMKEAYALENGSQEMFEVTRHALRRFVREHLGFFGAAFGMSLYREDLGGFYGRLGELCAGFLAALARELGLPAGPEALPLSSVEPDDVPMACGRGLDDEPGLSSFDV
ncbi:MAG TPA: molecular chaperone TorD family protein [Vicinamibacteria bacterium]|nr:molecular chaperone TorD family protein [Vicinamibacteria bacterium]